VTAQIHQKGAQLRLCALSFAYGKMKATIGEMKSTKGG
jgi:hypothetical protein